MATFNTQERSTPEEALQQLLSTGYDPAELERLLNDMLLHYIRPTKDWNLPAARITEVIDACEVMKEFLMIISKM